MAIKVLPLRNIWHVHLAKKLVSTFLEMPPHFAVVPLIDIDTASGFHYLAWPYEEGESVERFVARRGPMPLADVLRVAVTCAEAIANCHRHGIVHGCIHPGNLLIADDGSAKVIEWGVGAILSVNIADDESFLDTISTATAVSQNLDSLPPETIADPTNRTFEGDQYAFGCTLYAMATGVPPFPEGTLVDKMIAHQTLQPQPIHVRNPRVPESLSLVVGRMMSKRPSDRYPDWLEPIAMLRAVEGHVVTSSGMRRPAPVVEEPYESCHVLEGSNPSSATEPSLSHLSARPTIVRDRRVNSEGDVTFDLNQNDDETDNSFGIAVGRGRVGSTGEIPQIPVSHAFEESPVILQPSVKPIVLTGRSAMPLHGENDGTTEPLPDAKKEKQKKLSFQFASPVALSEMQTPSEVDASAPLLFKPKKPRWGWVSWIRSKLLGAPMPEVLQISLFGPLRIAAGQSIRLQAFAHSPVTFKSTKTLARAFTPDAELLVTGYADRMIVRGESLTFHLTVANAGVAEPYLTFQWMGQPFPSTFDLHVPWECQAGVTSAAISTAVDSKRTSTLPFTLTIESRMASKGGSAILSGGKTKEGDGFSIRRLDSNR